MPLDVPPSTDLVLAPTAQKGVEHLLQAWSRTPYATQFPIVAARIEPQVVHLATGTSPTAPEVALIYANSPPWFAGEFPAAWPPTAIQALNLELPRAFPTNPWTTAGRPDPHAAARAADTEALAAENLLGPAASVPVVTEPFALGAGAAALAIPLLVSWYLLASRGLGARPKAPCGTA